MDHLKPKPLTKQGQQQKPSYLLRLAEQEVMEMWVILHRLQQKKSSV